MKKLFTEYPEKNEFTYYDCLAEITLEQMENLYGGQTNDAKRDTHAKTHAAVKASLEIFDFDEDAIKKTLIQKINLPAAKVEGFSLKQGILAQAKEYPVWLRFANGKTTVENDYGDDARSMSIKIMGVEGERLPESHELHSQDIIVQNSDIFFIKTIEDYYGFFQAVVKSQKTQDKKPALFWLLTHPRQFLALKKTTKRIPKSLLTEHYWSGSAYALGLSDDFDPSLAGKQALEYPLVVKFGFIPVSVDPPHDIIPYQPRPGIPKFPWQNRAKALGLDGNSPDNYYRDNLISELQKEDACYYWDFGIQVQANPSMSIDDVTISWDEDTSPFLTVGRLKVKHQIIDFEQQKDFAENLRFSPWNGLTVHRPVGALNRLRKIVYPLVAKYRHQKRGVDYQEPTG